MLLYCQYLRNALLVFQQNFQLLQLFIFPSRYDAGGKSGKSTGGDGKFMEKH